jgi:hypothetical protein
VTTSTYPQRFVLIIGAMKCGTTTLFDLLGQHPAVCPARVKEPDFFTDGHNPRARSEYLQLWDWQPSAHEVAMEASVSYTKLPYFSGVAARILEAELGDVRFVYLMRHPVERIESQQRHGLYAGWAPSLDEQMHPDLLAYSSYATQLDEYRALFGRERLLPLFLDDVEQRPDDVLRVVCRFLGIDDTFRFTDVERKRNAGDFFQAQPWVSSLSQSGIGQRLLSHVPPGLKSRLRDQLTRLTPRRAETAPLPGRWKLNESERAHVWKSLVPELDRLEFEYGLTLPARWRTDSGLQTH